MNTNHFGFFWTEQKICEEILNLPTMLKRKKNMETIVSWAWIYCRTRCHKVVFNWKPDEYRNLYCFKNPLWLLWIFFFDHWNLEPSSAENFIKLKSFNSKKKILKNEELCEQFVVAVREHLLNFRQNILTDTWIVTLHCSEWKILKIFLFNETTSDEQTHQMQMNSERQKRNKICHITT